VDTSPLPRRIPGFLSDVAVEESTDIVVTRTVTFDISLPRAYEDADCYQKDNLFWLSPKGCSLPVGQPRCSIATDLRGRGEVKGNFDAPAGDVHRTVQRPATFRLPFRRLPATCCNLSSSMRLTLHDMSCFLFLDEHGYKNLGPFVQLGATHSTPPPLARTWLDSDRWHYNTRGSSTLYPCAWLAEPRKRS
jgi:hypothetical protein